MEYIVFNDEGLVDILNIDNVDKYKAANPDHTLTPYFETDDLLDDLENLDDSGLEEYY